MKEDTKKDILAAGAMKRELDAACKRVFQNKEIIAPILQMMVPEYKGCTVEEVIRCIEGDTIGDIPVEDIPIELDGMPTEFSSVTEKLIRYDVHFKALNPVLSSAEIRVQLHIDLEIQNDYRPGNPAYSIIKRGIYYAARELSAQLGSLSKQTDYGALEKVYSIWICNENIPADLRDTVTGYSFRKNDMIGSTKESEDDFDLLEVIIIRRGGKSREKIFDFLTAVFQGQLEKIGEYTCIEDNEKVKQEVTHMLSLGDSIMERGIEEGIERGKRETAQRCYEEGIDFDIAVKCTDLPIEELLKIYQKETDEKDTDKNNMRTRRLRR